MYRIESMRKKLVFFSNFSPFLKRKHKKMNLTLSMKVEGKRYNSRVYKCLFLLFF